MAALEGFLGARMLLHQSVYFHRTVRAIDLDLAEVFQPAIVALFGDDSPADRLADYVDLDEYALLHQAARWARGQDVAADGMAGGPGSGRVSRAVADGWRGILLRRPGWRAEAEIRASYEAGGEPRRRSRSSARPNPAGWRSTWRSSTRDPPATTGSRSRGEMAPRSPSRRRSRAFPRTPSSAGATEAARCDSHGGCSQARPWGDAAERSMGALVL